MTSTSTGQLQAPSVSLDDLQAFHTQHFPGQERPLPPNFAHENTQLNETEYYEDDDDGLGYYPDGMKRTITDEQIRIFRHSEIHAILRERQLEEEQRIQEEEDAAADKVVEDSKTHVTSAATAQGSMKSAQLPKDQKKDTGAQKSPGRSAPQGDQGDSGLDYDDDSSYHANLAHHAAAAAASRLAGRRIISYDD
ncbi:predicted protein [Paecilomyces variotii No. 5]|uniref:Uncharacterized protein n=1 Tax=Byssochlamys spectabilis (strain No. 5 / NBRC 109023) TaxID=1356009 RepID=V5FZZ6_BYSSN|nr:predicted protein [Paecilomyces variotii No. 5]